MITTAAISQRALWRELAPICGVVFLEFLAMGLPLAVLPVHVQGSLGFGSFAVGIAIGAQSWASSSAASRIGVALGAYAACFDVSMGVGVPLLGLVVALRGYAAAFGAGAVAALLALLVAVALSWTAKTETPA